MNTALQTTKKSPMSLSLFGKVKAALEEVNIDLEAIIETHEFFSEQQKNDPDFIIPTYRAKIPAGESKAFNIITGDDDMDTSVNTFNGVIASFHNTNALFEEEENGAVTNKMPLCQSPDGITGICSETNERRECSNCPNNQWGSAKKGRKGKECKNMRRLYILVEGSNIPIVMTLPPTSIKPWENYRANLAVQRKTPCDVVTEFSLTFEHNTNGVKYSAAKFKALGLLNLETRTTVKALISGESFDKNVSDEDYNTQKSENEPAENASGSNAD